MPASKKRHALPRPSDSAAAADPASWQRSPFWRLMAAGLVGSLFYIGHGLANAQHGAGSQTIQGQRPGHGTASFASFFEGSAFADNGQVIHIPDGGMGSIVTSINDGESLLVWRFDGEIAGAPLLQHVERYDYWAKQDEKSPERITAATITLVSQSLKAYELDFGLFPSTSQGLQALIERPADISEDIWDIRYFDSDKIPTDAWGRELQYRHPPEHGAYFDLFSMGADGVADTEDDIVGWTKDQK